MIFSKYESEIGSTCLHCRWMLSMLFVGVTFLLSAQCDLTKILEGRGNDVSSTITSEGIRIWVTVTRTEREILEEQTDMIFTCACEYDLRGYFVESSDYWYRFIGASSTEEGLGMVAPHLNAWVTNACNQLDVGRPEVIHRNDGSMNMTCNGSMSRSRLAQILASDIQESLGQQSSRYGSLEEGLDGLFRDFKIENAPICQSLYLAEGRCVDPNYNYRYYGQASPGCSECQLGAIWDGAWEPVNNRKGKGKEKEKEKEKKKKKKKR